MFSEVLNKDPNVVFLLCLKKKKKTPPHYLITTAGITVTVAPS